MYQFPMVFESEAEAASGLEAVWTTTAAGVSPTISMAIPPEFDGPGGALSPEDLYGLALQNCFIATFKVFAQKSKLEFATLRTRGRLEVDRDEAGRPWMAKFHLHAELAGTRQTENARRVLEKTSQGCLILNSVKTQKTFEFVVNAVTDETSKR